MISAGIDRPTAEAIDMSENDPEIKGRADPGEPLPKDRSEIVEQIGKTAISETMAGKK